MIEVLVVLANVVYSQLECAVVAFLVLNVMPRWLHAPRSYGTCCIFGLILHVILSRTAVVARMMLLSNKQSRCCATWSACIRADMKDRYETPQEGTSAELKNFIEYVQLAGGKEENTWGASWNRATKHRRADWCLRRHMSFKDNLKPFWGHSLGSISCRYSNIVIPARGIKSLVHFSRMRFDQREIFWNQRSDETTPERLCHAGSTIDVLYSQKAAHILVWVWSVISWMNCWGRDKLLCERWM